MKEQRHGVETREGSGAKRGRFLFLIREVEVSLDTGDNDAVRGETW